MPARAIEAVATDPSIYEPLIGPSREPAQMQSSRRRARALLVFLDLPLLTGKEVPWAPHVAAFASPWPGSELVLRSACDSNYALDTTLTQCRHARPHTARTSSPARYGAGTRQPASHPPQRRYAVVQGRSCGVRRRQCDRGGKRRRRMGGAAVRHRHADRAQWWTLTRLLRGQAGTEFRHARTGRRRARWSSSTARCCSSRLPERSNAAVQLFLRAARQAAFRSVIPESTEQQFAAIGLRPLSPTQLSAVFTAGGDLVLSWIRRTRIGGDSWNQTDVPLAEESEAYAIDILDGGGNVVRTLTASTPTIAYTAAQIATDFPSGLRRRSLRCGPAPPPSAAAQRPKVQSPFYDLSPSGGEGRVRGYCRLHNGLKISAGSRAKSAFVNRKTR